jgi:hypothetical protein
MRSRKIVGAALLLLIAARAGAERINCVDSQVSQVTAHTAEQTLAIFEWSGVSLDAQTDPAEQVLVFQCSGTVLLEAARKRYNYLCEFHDEAGEKFSLQNGDDALEQMQYVRGGGTGRYADRTGAAPEYRRFPINGDGSLTNCDPNQTALRLP